jgi:hypothetical protein
MEPRGPYPPRSVMQVAACPPSRQTLRIAYSLSFPRECRRLNAARTPGVLIESTRGHPLGRIGADTLMWLATSADVANVSGKYFFGRQQRMPRTGGQD